MKIARVLLLCLVGCNSEPLGGPEVDAGADLLPDRCVGKSESACGSDPACAADHCASCGCGESYAGCRAVAAPPTECPLLGCPAHICDSCYDLDQTSCNASAALGCTAVSCPDCAGKLTMYLGCYGPNDGAPFCPTPVCKKPGCRSDQDCGLGEGCLVEHDPAWQNACKRDQDCRATYFCVDSACSSQLGTCEPLPD